MPPINWTVIRLDSGLIIGFIVTVLAVIAGTFVYVKYLGPMIAGPGN